MTQQFKLTYSTMFSPPEALHTRFEQALASVKSRLGQTHGHYINGENMAAGRTREKRSPIDQDLVLGRFAEGTPEEAEMAINAAHKAFPAWRNMPYSERNRILRKAASLIEERVYEMSAAVALEVGKNRMEALGDIAEAADLMRYACDQMELHKGYAVPMGRDPLKGYRASNTSILRPYGVWLVISPFNFPAALTGGPVGAALVAGNTVVMKPATDTPWTVRLLAECFRVHGTVQDAHVVMDRETGQSKGFGFVEMGSSEEAQAAMEALDGQEFEGRNLRVNEAQPRSGGG